MYAATHGDRDRFSLVHNVILVAGKTRFKVIERLGVGGNSAVYMVQCVTGPHRGMLFAAKLFLKNDKEDRAERFRVELDFLKRPQHPAVMRVYYDGSYAVTDDDGVVQLPFYIAEYLPKTLRDAMRSGLLMVDKVAIAMQLLSALAYLSENDPVIVHRDIKPENIFIKGRSAVLGDFGLLKAIGSGESSSSFSIGGLSKGVRHPRFYPSPELVEYAKGRLPDVSAKSDIFQLGLVLAELFSGTSPLVERETLDKVELAELAIVFGSQGELVRTNIKRMLSIDPNDRPSAAELFDSWDGVFMSVLDDARRLEGRAFW